ncbi:MAG: hypothetical protein GY750_20065 [Lentisphaerae bacterium]|nr:hypothetical protein [Lentisphaerota bacterium]MCP4103690.1 hypothetical protein [Lentisphaerota bacterium]
MKAYNILIITAFSALTILSGGCGNEKVPDPPLTRTKIVISLFNNLEKKQYKRSVRQIEKLQALDPDSIFLHQLKESELSNQYTKQAQVFLAQGKLQDAVGIIKKGRDEYPFNDNLIQAENKLTKLLLLNKYIDNVEQSKNADALEINLNATKKLLSEIPNGKKLQPFIRRELIRAHKLKMRESAMARFDLLCDIKTMEDNKDSIAKIMQAEFDLVNSNPKYKSVAVDPELLK